jgi:hypothetical protein
MQEQSKHVPGLWIVLPAVASAMDEQGLSKRQALAMLKEFVSEQPASIDMQETVARLKSAKNELALRFMLGEECLRLMELDAERS